MRKGVYDSKAAKRLHHGPMLFDDMPDVRLFRAHPKPLEEASHDDSIHKMHYFDDGEYECNRALNDDVLLSDARSEDEEDGFEDILGDLEGIQEDSQFSERQMLLDDCSDNSALPVHTIIAPKLLDRCEDLDVIHGAELEEDDMLIDEKYSTSDGEPMLI